jgi:hypothetical protein
MGQTHPPGQLHSLFGPPVQMYTTVNLNLDWKGASKSDIKDGEVREIALLVCEPVCGLLLMAGDVERNRTVFAGISPSEDKDGSPGSMDAEFETDQGL